MKKQRATTAGLATILAAICAVALAVACTQPAIDKSSATQPSETTTTSSAQNLATETPATTDSPAVIAAPPPAAVRLTSAVVVRVVDGDTAVFRLSEGTTEKTRFIGIDTPESTTKIEPYGKEASAYTASVLTVGRTVYLEKDAEARDRYGRLLAYVWLRPPTEISTGELRLKLFNAKLAANGYAQQMTIPPNVKYAEYLRAFVAEAREEDRGLWRQSVSANDEGAAASAPSAGTQAAKTTGAAYIGNNNTMKFHHPDCASVPTIHQEHVVKLSSRDQAIGGGYVPCGNCRP